MDSYLDMTVKYMLKIDDKEMMSKKDSLTFLTK